MGLVGIVGYYMLKVKGTTVELEQCDSKTIALFTSWLRSYLAEFGLVKFYSEIIRELKKRTSVQFSCLEVYDV